ncbi:MerR family DNA-binding transcriptional regulator [Denitrobaculum tricleocarpae]|uniref:MerR family DNA-binding transcriptional regulator n=2 Tax=Denitrobaculum tricleocarpae TaxID=2591009 RepID=A0A545TLB5_9PROT|nr:MerR family DNA-binding transcriptional regulator [Denitrobaculum tricleocarpae]
MGSELDIGEVARRSGLPASTLRYYEEKGLIRSSGRKGLRRLFDPGVLDQLALITLGRLAQFKLEELPAMLPGESGAALDRAKINEKAQELDRRIDELTALSKLLRHVAECRADNHFSCPRFKKLLRIAFRLREDDKKRHPGKASNTA